MNIVSDAQVSHYCALTPDSAILTNVCATSDTHTGCYGGVFADSDVVGNLNLII